MNDNKEHMTASPELQEMISQAMIKRKSGDASDELKESISKAMESKSDTGSFPKPMSGSSATDAADKTNTASFPKPKTDSAGQIDGDASDELKESISKAMESKSNTGSFPKPTSGSSAADAADKTKTESVRRVSPDPDGENTTKTAVFQRPTNKDKVRRSSDADAENKTRTAVFQRPTVRDEGRGSSVSDKSSNNRGSENKTNSAKSVSKTTRKDSKNDKTADRKSGRKSKAANSENSSKQHTSNVRGGWSVRKKTGVTLGFIFLALVLVMGIIVVLFFHYTGLLKRPDNSVRTDKAPVDSRDLVDGKDTLDEEAMEKELRTLLEQKSKKISNENVMNILLIGEDVRDTAKKDRGNTDVMMLISINRDNRTITLTSLMRDTWVYMEKFNVNAKLNQAYWHGGAEYLSEVIEDYFSVEIDRTVKVNFRQFIDIVETVGGLDLEVSYTEAVAMRDPMDEQNKYLHNPEGTDYIDLEQYGKEDWVNYYTYEGKFRTSIQYQSDEDNKIMMHLNGNQALAYARVRYGCGDDYGRTMRQRIVISEIIKNAKKLSLVQLDELMNKVLPEVETDLEEGEIANMLLNAFDYMSYDVQQLRLPADNYYSFEVIWQQDVLSLKTWQFQANAAFLRYIVYGDCRDIDEAVERYQAEIDDGTFYENNDFVPPVYW